jgi:nitroimidazol reductase NimA-like FMN-containing flavoprotein (pyridoxamine 5'-phosphate oxidase superfamily)
MLSAAAVGRLACTRQDQPYIVPIHLEFDGECLYGFATLGQKIEWMRLNPLVCVEVDDVTSQRQWSSVVAFGEYEELPATAAHEESRGVAERLFQKRPMWWEPALVPLASDTPRDPILFRIRISRLTGRRVQRVPTAAT